MSGFHFQDIVSDILSLASQQQGGKKSTIYGHLSNYDVTTHMVKALIPSWRDADNNMYETGWMQLNSPWVGNGWGWQARPMANATIDQLQQGEQVELNLIHSPNGSHLAASITYNDNATPPGAGQEDGDTMGDPTGQNMLQPGESILRHQSGSFFKFYANGDIQVSAARDINAVAARDANVTTTRNVNVTAAQAIHVTATAGPIDVTATAGPIDVTATAGNIVVLASAGDIDVTATVGNINTTATAGNIAAVATAGNISAVAAGNIVATSTAGNITTLATAGNITNTATAGNITSTAVVGNCSVIAETGDVTITSVSGYVAIAAATLINIVCATEINIQSVLTKIGSGAHTLQQLCNIAFMALYNAHVHEVPGGGLTSTTNLPGTEGIDTTIDTVAS